MRSSQLTPLKETIDQADGALTARLQALRNRVARDTQEQAQVLLLSEDDWMAAAERLRSSSAPIDAATELASVSAAGGSALTPERLHEFRAGAELYARQLDALRTLLPAQPPKALSDTSSVPALLRAVAEANERRNSLISQRQQLIDGLRNAGQTAQANAAQRDQRGPRWLTVAGTDVTRLLASPATLDGRINRARNALDGINRRTSLLAGAITQLPRWTVADTTQPDTVLGKVYASGSEVRITVLRRDRYAPWVAAGPAAAPKPAAPAAAGTLTVATTTTVTQGGAAIAITPNATGAAADGGLASLSTSQGNDTVAVLTIPVLPRYRFHLGVGMIYSPLETTAYETRADSLNGAQGTYVFESGTDGSRFAPMALLGYTIYPFAGRFVDARAYRGPFRDPTVAIQAGLGLEHPADQRFLGVTAEFIPGLQIGVGRYWERVTTSPYQDGDFVPDNRLATTREWRSKVAGSLTLDAVIIAKTFGGLLGL